MGESKVNTLNLNDIFQDVKTDMIGKLLNDTKDSKKCLWYLICALDGMDENDIVELAERTIPQIQAARNEFLMKKYQGNREVYKEVLRIKSQVNDVVQENREVRSSIEAGLDKAIQEQIEKANKLVEAKDEMIEMLKYQKIELQRQIEQLKSNVINLEKQQEEKTNRIQQTESAEITQVKAEREKERNKNSITDSDVEIFSEQASSTNKKQSLIKRAQKYFFSVTDTKAFAEKYLSNDNLTEEQKNYLLKCLEQGMTVKEIGRFASENLSVEHMERLKKIIESRKG